MDEVFVSIQGKRHYLWRAVDQDGQVLDILVQTRRDQRAATRFFRKLLRGLRYVPRLLVTDRLRSYGVARRELFPSVAHCQEKRANNRAEASHQPTRHREQQMRQFKSPGQAQRFLSVHSPINNLFRLGRHLLPARHYRALRTQAFATWRDVTELSLAAYPQWTATANTKIFSLFLTTRQNHRCHSIHAPPQLLPPVWNGPAPLSALLDLLYDETFEVPLFAPAGEHFEKRWRTLRILCSHKPDACVLPLTVVVTWRAGILVLG